MNHPNLHKTCPDQFNSTAHRWARRWAQTASFVIVFTLAGLALGNRIAADEAVTPFQRAVSTPLGTLKSPYRNPARVAEEGLGIYRSLDCSGCHGGGGGGGMAPPLTNPVWIYGADDDTLFRVIALGTGSLSPGNAFGKLGYTRTGFESVAGPMPPYGQIIEHEDDVWKIISWIRSLHPNPDK